MVSTGSIDAGNLELHHAGSGFNLDSIELINFWASFGLISFHINDGDRWYKTRDLNNACITSLDIFSDKFCQNLRIKYS